MLISIEFYLFYIIVINYVIELFDKYNYLFIIINKFSCCLQLIPNYITNFAIV